MTVDEALKLPLWTPVKAINPINEAIVEGHVYDIQPYGHPEIDSTWTEKATIIIQDSKTYKYSHWRPSYVSRN